MPPAGGGEEVLIDSSGFGGGGGRVPARFRNRAPGERPARTYPRAGSPSPGSSGGRPRPMGVSAARTRAASPGAAPRARAGSPGASGRKALRPRATSDDATLTAPRFRMGEAIEAKYKQGSKWFKGNVVSANPDGTYDVRYDDGDEERAVKAMHIQKRDGGGSSPRSSPRAAGLSLGDKVEARYRGREKFYPGKISRDRGDGTFDIDYDDGEKETRVDEKLIRSKDGGSSSSGGKGGLKEGEKVEARYRGKEKFYPGKISRNRNDGTFDIDYDDGEKETRVDEKLIRSKDGGSSSSAAKGGFMEGDKVEARYKGREKFYPGKISRDRGDGTYDINYDDGEREIRIDEKLIRSKDGGSSSSSGKGGLKEGEKVEARYRGREKFYPGKITRDRGDGTFDIDYDDGEKETRVDEKLIRSKDGGSSSGAAKDGFMEGDKVEARYKGREKFYPGKISRDRGDGTYDINYDDGEREIRIDEKMIRANDIFVRAGSSAPKGGLKEGDTVEARYRGREKFYPGKIFRYRRDGTFDIDYDDGEKETRVDEKLIRSMDGGGSGGGKGNLKEGDKIEARYRGREKFYPGKITRDRGDGTFDIDYDDGEKETRVDEKLIRSKDGGARSSGGNGSLMVGDKVEARYRGREKFYTGKIIRNRAAAARAT
ncbi:hypothetical protein M885DRAFT_570320 [Pelagophyceae sp. CCMP2097]|nr:hypothetical protein M885DRAFT_570320 [Pelagophyceae sp. CCMP2097]